MAFQPYENIISLISEDVTVPFPDDMGNITLRKGVQTKEQEATASREYAELNRWKTDKLQSSGNTLRQKVPVASDAGIWHTINLPAKTDDKIFLVTPECAAVGRKLEGRNDLVTKADLFRLLRYTKGKMQYDLRKN